ncbi:MAG: alpha/beta hydrolase [Pseudomonadota bacterium]
MGKLRLRGFPAALSLVLLAGCGSLPSPGERLLQAERLAADRGWQRQVLSAGRFQLTVFMPRNLTRGGRLAVYVEGDGFAWETPTRPSADPTPLDALGLVLALTDPGPVAYLARPCQFALGADPACTQDYWTGRRFSPEVLESVSQALDMLKVHTGARRLRLVGYSGGATVAALVAAGRADVDDLVTVAGNLDLSAWSRHHRLSPLAGSLDPADYRHALARLPQWHFVGGDDRVVPPELTMDYVAGFPPGSPAHLVVMPGFDHRCCWQTQWSTLLQSLP